MRTTAPRVPAESWLGVPTRRNREPGRAALWLTVAGLALFACTGRGAAQTATPPPGAAQADVEAEIPGVFLAGERVTGISTGVGPFSAQQRAARISERLAAILHDRSVADPRVSVSDEDNLTYLRVGSHLVMGVTEVDAAAVGVARRRVAVAYAEEIERALRAERARRTPAALFAAAAKALAATVALVAVLWSLLRAWHGINRRLGAWRVRRLESLRITSVELLSSARLSQVFVSLQRLLRALVVLVAFDVYLTYVLGLFPWTRTSAVALVRYALAPLEAGWNAVVGYLPNLFFVLFIAFVAWYAIRFVGAFFDAVARERIRFESFPADWAEPTNKIARVLLVAFALVIAFPYLPGSDSPAFAGISVMAGVLLSLASSSSLSNMIAGIVLTYTGAFRLGERVKIGETAGDIVELSLLVTRIRTIKNEDVTIPNGIVLASQVVNYSRQAHAMGLILHTSVTIGYDAPWRQVHRLLVDAASKTDGILASPPPFVWQTALNDFYVNYEINAYTDRPLEMPRIYADLHANIQDSFYASGVEIMSPHFTAVRDGNAMAIPRDQWPAGYEPARFRVERRAAPAAPAGDLPVEAVPR